MRLMENVGGRHPNETLINFGFGFINLDLDSDENIHSIGGVIMP